VRVFMQVLAAKEYDISDTAQGKELRRRYDSLIACGIQPLIIDCGANIGLSGVWYSRQFPEAKIIAVVPDQSNLEIASKNLAAYPNVTLVSGGVWDTRSLCQSACKFGSDAFLVQLLIERLSA
jgi:predicted O-methyltransferase YrrM